MNSHIQDILDLIVLAQETGMSEDKQFVEEIEKLSMRFDRIRFNELKKKCFSSQGLPSLLNRTFRKPVTDEELAAVRGDYVIGKIVDSDIEVGLSKKGLVLHTLISGAVGFGKTTTLNVLADSIYKKGDVKQWFIDPKTRMYDFRWMIKKYPNTLVIPLSKLRLNPFAPIKGVPRKTVMEKSIEVISDSYNVLDASQGVVAEHVENLFNREEIPCFAEVAKSILSEKSQRYGRRNQYLDTLEVRIKNTLMSLRDVFDCREDYFNHMFDKHVIFEVGGISDFALKVLVPLIIMKLSLYKTYNPTNYLDTLLYFEEAQGAVFSKLLEQRARTPTVATLATLCRSYGLGLAVLCQNPVTKIITEVLSNSANLICFHVGGTEVKGMTDCMGLTYDQASMLQHIQTGEAIFKTNFGYTEPLHIKVNWIDNTPPSDEEVKTIMQPAWDKLFSHVTPVEDKEQFSGSEPKNENNPTVEKNNTNKVQKPSGSTFNIPPDAELLLRDIELRPFAFIDERYRQCTISKNRAIKAKKWLLRHNFIEEIPVKLGKRGKPSKLTMLCEKAYSHLGIQPPKSKGSLEHRFYQQMAAHFAKQSGLSAKIEDSGCDVSISKGNEFVALEITLNDSNIQHNIERNMKNGFSQIWFAVKNEAMLKNVNEKLVEIALLDDRIKVFLLSEIIINIKEFCGDR